MHKSKRLFCIVASIIAFAFMTACGSSAQNSEAPKALMFSDMQVQTDMRTGFFGGRYASFEVKGSVTNRTGNPINVDNLPVLTCDGEEVTADLSQEKLLEGETCNVTWKKELTVKDNTIPELSFTGSVKFDGLEDCQTELNQQLQEIAGKYAAEDSAREEERKAEEKAQADAAQKREDDKSALNGCKGKTAIEAKAIAVKTDYEPKFMDSYDVDVTNDVKDDSEVGSSVVASVTVDDGGWFSDPSVTFTLDYIDPEGQKEREENAAKKKAEEEEAAKKKKEAAKKEAEKKAKEEAAAKKEAEDKEWVQSMPGRPLMDVLGEIDDRGLGYRIVIHPSGTDVTENLTRQDLANRGLVVMQASKVGYSSPYGMSKLKEGDIDIKAVDPAYWENEKSLENTLPRYNAERAVKQFAKAHGMKSVDIWYEEAVDSSTWYIKGDAKLNGARVTIEVKVTGTKSSPAVVEFNYY